MTAMSSNASRLLLGVAAAALLGLVGYGALRSQGFEPSVLSTGLIPLEVIEQLPDFAVSPDPGEAILSMSINSPSTGSSISYSLFGDGRLERAKHTTEGQELMAEVFLDFDQVQQLFRMAILCGLAETSQSDLTKKIHESQVAQLGLEQEVGATSALPAPSPPGSSTSIMEIRFVRFGQAGARENKLAIQGLDVAHTLNPDILELEGWTEILRSLRNLTD